MSTYKVYICPKASDIDKRNHFFQHIIAYYGNSVEYIDVYCNNFRCDIHYTPNFINYVVEKMKYLCNVHNSILFYFYSPKLAYLIIKQEPLLKKYIPYLNPYTLLQQLDDKITCRTWVKEYTNIVPFQVLSFDACLDKMRKNHINQISNSYVIQFSDSCGGEGTYIFVGDIINNDKACLQTFPHDALFLLSPYYETSIAATCHFIVYKDTEIIFPIGISKSLMSNNLCIRPIYQGTDYTKSHRFSKEIKNKICKSVRTLSRQLALMGYRGICGIDFLIIHQDIYIMEINPRYLGSSYLVDMALLDNQMPPLAFFNEHAFNCSSPQKKYVQSVENLKIPYEGYLFSHNECFNQDSFNTLINNLPSNWYIFWDGLDTNIPLTEYERDTYLFRAYKKVP